jgi:hypothetical protein
VVAVVSCLVFCLNAPGELEYRERDAAMIDRRVAVVIKQEPLADSFGHNSATNTARSRWRGAQGAWRVRL